MFDGDAIDVFATTVYVVVLCGVNVHTTGHSCVFRRIAEWDGGNLEC